jgi:hypothetical protein
MITKTDFTVDFKLLDEAVNLTSSIKGKLTLNQPRGRFFYDPWEIKPEYKNTVWEKILNSLGPTIGEARLINLEIESCYASHADIDDRWHLAITGNNVFLIDLDNDTMYRTNETGTWYLMDAGRRHSAVNFGSNDRVQLVVRQLLDDNVLKNPIDVDINALVYSRFDIDDKLSPWLNTMSKKGIISDFSYTNNSLKLKIEKEYFDDFKKIVDSIPKRFI